MGKILTVYFSASDATRRVAEKLAAASGSELYEIEPAIPYSDADLNWRDHNSRSSVEMRNRAARPEIAASKLELDAYDTIWLGFPIWHYVAPRIVQTFLESLQFDGKSVVLFATSGGSGFGNTLKELAASAPSAKFTLGKIFYDASENSIKEFVRRFRTE